MYTEEVNKIALSSNDDKRLQASNRITRYLEQMEQNNIYRTDEMMMINK